MAERQATKGLTARGEEWLRDVLGNCFAGLAVPVLETRKEHIVQFLARYEGKPWRKRSMYLGLRSFWGWASKSYNVPNPFLDQFGNTAIEAPHTPSKLLTTQTVANVQLLMDAATSLRDKALVSLLADSGARLSEIAGGRRGERPGIQMADLDLPHCRIRVVGKGGKEGFLLFGDVTAKLLREYIAEAQPTGKLFPLTYYGMDSLLDRLAKRTGIKCNAHSFRRGFATELRRNGVGELDIMELGRWSSVSMVQRYTRAYTFEDAAVRYKAIVT